MLDDTIHAVATPPGPAARAVLRLSGAAALRAAAAVFAPALPCLRCQREGSVQVLGQRVPALALVMPAPHSYTGEDVVELHVPGSPLLCAHLSAALQAQAPALPVRPALPGEFTRRAYEHGKLDLLQAEGVLLLIHGEDEAATRAGLAWLAGGLSAAVATAVAKIQDGLALLEAGLDFLSGETGEVAPALWREPVAAAAALLAELRAGLPPAAPGGEVLLLGPANAGKSSLANALAGRAEVIVDAAPGTTRDLLRVELAPGVAVWDAPGDLDQASAADEAALVLRDRLAGRAAAALLVVDPEATRLPRTGLPVLAVVATKQDLGRLPPALAPPAEHAAAPRFPVSAKTGAGIGELRAFLLARGSAGSRTPGLPVLAALDGASAALRAALAPPAGSPDELRCAELQRALQLLGQLGTSHAPEDLLDRIFGRFCLGK